MNGVVITELRVEDRGFALASWRDSHHENPKIKRMPWGYYKREYGAIFSRILDDGGTLALGAYRMNPVDQKEELLAYLIATPGKRVDTLHWVYVKCRDAAGGWLRRHGLMNDLIAAAELGKSFVYTLQARKVPGIHRTLDRQLAAVFATRGVTAVHEPLMEWIK